MSKVRTTIYHETVEPTCYAPYVDQRVAIGKDRRSCSRYRRRAQRCDLHVSRGPWLSCALLLPLRCLLSVWAQLHATLTSCGGYFLICRSRVNVCSFTGKYRWVGVFVSLQFICGAVLVLTVSSVSVDCSVHKWGRCESWSSSFTHYNGALLVTVQSTSITVVDELYDYDAS